VIAPDSIRSLAQQVASGKRTAVGLVSDAIEAVRAKDPALGAVTRLLDADALVEARRIDARIAAGERPGPLAGIPFGVKDLFDVAGLVNTAGSAIRAGDPPARQDAEAVRRLRAAGAILIATLNMDEFAYGFATINAHHGTTRNPHDTTRLAGGSSGGSAAAVAGGLMPLALGSDTNGSIRVPASLCGVFGLKPTHGALPMAGVAPFVDSFDDIGPFAARLDDLRLAYEVLRGVPVPSSSGEDLRVGRLTGWFARNLTSDAEEAIEMVATAVEGPGVALDSAETARSAAFLMTAAEGGAVHLADLRTRPMAFDPAVRDRLLAGAMLPAAVYREAQQFRVQFAAEAARLFDRFDVLVAPATGCVAPPIAEPTIPFEGGTAPARSHLGIFTQPLSFIGLPVLAVPVARPGRLPIGVQLVGPPGGEDRLFALAGCLERAGLLAHGVAR